MRPILKLLLIIIIALPLACKATLFENKFIAYQKHTETIDKVSSFKEKAHLHNNIYQELFSKEMLRATSKSYKLRDLSYLFQATETVLFYTRKEQYARDLSMVFTLIKKRNGISNQKILSLYRAYIRVRMFNEAKNLKEIYPLIIIEELPEFTNSIHLDSYMKSAWFPSLNTTTLERKNIDLSKGNQILMIAHPLCHFSNNAIHAIQVDAQLNNTLFNNMKLLAPQDGRLNFDKIQKWNREHNNIQIAIVHKQSEWLEIDEWSTPVFYFFKEGVLKFKFTGWPREGNKDKLIQGLKLIDLLPQDESNLDKLSQ